MANGFFTDTTLCIGCKACEVACKQWNQLPAEAYELTGNSYDNTMALGGTTWRHVAFVEQTQLEPQFEPPTTQKPGDPGGSAAGGRAAAGAAPVEGSSTVATRWLMMSDVCKHCTHAGCLEACPTGAIIRNEFDDVYIQPDVCNGCGYCVPSCPFGVVDLIEHAGYAAERTFSTDGRSSDDALQQTGGIAGKCTLCYDRQRVGFTPACAKACPTESIQFGDVEDLKARARRRVETLRGRGVDAYLYGVDETTSVGDLNAFFLLTERPEAYNLPARPVLPSTHQSAGYMSGALAAAALALVGLALFKGRP